jgi:DtxR family Mn-dependent transcriptional regulator
MKKKTIEDYLELIYDLQKERKRVHTNDIAAIFGINPASVTEIFQKLSDVGYINYEKYSGVILTGRGKKIAKQTKKKHNTLREFLLILGIDEEIAEKDACEMEHILHPRTLDMIIKFGEVLKQCKVTPFWQQRMRQYVKTGKLSKCPTELIDVCLKYSKNSNANKLL